jgi:asparagine synthase (glutamine-hydrolysing)
LDVADIVDPGLEEPGIRTIFRGGTMGDVAIARTNGASVILSGLGGDQLGTVEGYIKDLISNGKWREAIDELMFFPKANTRSRIRRLTRLTQQFAPAWLLQMRTKMRRRFPKWLTGEMRSLAAELAPPEVPPISGVSNVQRYTWKRLMSVETLRNVSMMNVHASLHEMEYRFPFLDKDLILFSLSIPYEAWPRPGAYARLHREALADLLPTEISERMGKAEFTSALVNKVRRASRSIMALFGTDWASGRYLDREQALSFCRGVLDGGIVGSVAWRQVWAMATLEAWLRGILAYDAAEKGN